MDALKGFLSGRKTYLLAIAALITTGAAWASGDLSTQDAIQSVFASLGAMTIRAGVTKSGTNGG